MQKYPVAKYLLTEYNKKSYIFIDKSLICSIIDIMKEDSFTAIKPIQVSVPFTDFEKNRLDIFLNESGMKKGAFMRIAAMEKLDREEAALNERQSSNS